MSWITWQPLKDLDILRHQMNHLFDELMEVEVKDSGNTTWKPVVEIKQTDADIILQAEIPGVDAKDLDVQVSEEAVSIAGERKQEKHISQKDLFRSEFRYGQFRRVIALPVSVNYTEVKAEFDRGVLTLTLPKLEVKTPKSLKVDLAVEEKAREAMAGTRQYEEHLEKTMHERATEELETSSHGDIPEEARSGQSKQRQHEEHLEKTMHERAASEIKVPKKN
ncbi:MAG: Hsp20/alpha crystallin family protein [Calothrix sp. MO_167.B42]|nr:Hsp20/alpha crystallin family protein [Calothrix sp. MO_167.B42]